jgi:EmrB/QacA subfamily drug resistance transporter
MLNLRKIIHVFLRSYCYYTSNNCFWEYVFLAARRRVSAMSHSDSELYPNKWPILFVVAAMSFMSCLDSSIINVALPAMAHELRAPLAAIEWVVTSYLLVICATILIFGRLGDLRGKNKIFQWGMVVFTLGSLLCGLSGSLPVLVFCRTLQGIGAAAYMANNQGIITQSFPPQERGKALGTLASMVALGTMLGPVLGGFILTVSRWNCIFFINVPIGMGAIWYANKLLTGDRHAAGQTVPFDLKGALLMFIAITCFFAAILGEQRFGLANPLILICIGVALVGFVAFIGVEHRNEAPLLQLGLFRNGLFTVALLCAFIYYVCLSASIILLPFYLQQTLKLAPWLAGLVMMIAPLMMTIGSPASGSLSDKIGSELLSFIGLTVMSLGFLALSGLNQHASLAHLVAFVALIGLGQALFQPANNSLIMSAVPKNKLGIAGGINSLDRNLGQIMGVTVATTLLYNWMSHKIGYRVTDYIPGRDDVFVFGMRQVYLTLVALCGAGAVVTLIRLWRKRRFVTK